MDPRKQYLKEMYGKFKYFATWLPINDLKLGDIGVIKGGVKIGALKVTKPNEFERVSTLEKKKSILKLDPVTLPGILSIPLQKILHLK
jgi:hypothetical protein